MCALSPVAFDIETSGFAPGSVVTVAGLGFDVGTWLGLNTAGRDVDRERLEAALGRRVAGAVHLAVRGDESALLDALATAAGERIDPDRHYLTAYNGERWRGGFDLPFLRTACARADADWPFGDLAYADAMALVERFDTGEADDLAGAYEALVGDDEATGPTPTDPFADSAAAVTAHEDAAWVDLLAHNVADVRRTRALAVLAGRYVPKSDFGMKNLAPPDR